MLRIPGWVVQIRDRFREFLRACGRKFVAAKNFLMPLADLRIMLILLVLGGVLLLGADAGKDVIRQLVDSANATDFKLSTRNAPIFLRWTLFFLACVWTGLNAWYWAHLLYKSNPGAVVAQPNWFMLVRRGLGIIPLVCAIIAMPISARHGLKDNWIAMLLFAIGAALLLWFFIARNSIALRMNDWKLNQVAGDPNRGANTIVRGDYWFIYATTAVSAVALLALSTPVLRTHFAWTVGPAALTFGAIGCIIPLTSGLIYYTRRYEIPIVLVGVIAFVVFSAINDNHKIRHLSGKATELSRPTVLDAYNTWQAMHTDPNDPVILIASAGGASRAAYWTGTVLRAFDDRTKGTFFNNVFAISSVSGGTLGAIGYAAWLADRSVADEAAGAEDRLNFVQSFFGQDYLGPSLGGLLYPDLLQRFLPAPIFFDRASSLEEAFEMGWNYTMRNCGGKPSCGGKLDRLSQEFTGLWANSMLQHKADGRWVPIVLANGTNVETGKRIITAPVMIESSIFEDAYDFYDLNSRQVRGSTAVLNSARFTLVSPAGRMVNGSATTGGVIDGGYFENGALETLYDVARFIKAQQKERRIIIIEILNDDTMDDADLVRHPSQALVAKSKDKWSSGLLGEFTSIIGGLYETRSSRGILTAKRLSASRESGLGENTVFASFDLRPFGNDCPATDHETKCYTAMSWALSQGSRDAMDVSFNTTLKDIEREDFFKNRPYTEERRKQQIKDLEFVINESHKPRGHNATLRTVLESVGPKVSVEGVEAPAAAAERY